MKILKSHTELHVFQCAFRSSMEIFSLSKSFPKEEVFSLTSRSVSANISEAFRKRRYEKAFVAKLSDSEAEAAETQVWLQYSFECGYLPKSLYQQIYQDYEKIIGMLVVMILHPDKWSLR